jgi:hypothetical protein
MAVDISRQVSRNWARLAAGEITAEQARAENRRIKQCAGEQAYAQARVAVIARFSGGER